MADDAAETPRSLRSLLRGLTPEQRWRALLLVCAELHSIGYRYQYRPFVPWTRALAMSRGKKSR